MKPDDNSLDHDDSDPAGGTSGAPEVTIEMTIAAPVEAVWRSLRDPALIRAWHGWHFAGLDEEVNLIYLDGVTADDDAHVLHAAGEDTFSCTAVPGGTRVRVTRPTYRPGEEWSDYYDDVTEGWTTFLQQLRFLHERHPGQDRRTIAVMGSGSPAAVADLWGTVPSTVGPDWFATATQRGALLPDLGPGLLIMYAKPAPEAQVFAMAVITTYGLDDAAFAPQRDVWTGWWRSGFPEAEPAQF